MHALALLPAGCLAAAAAITGCGSTQPAGPAGGATATVTVTAPGTPRPHHRLTVTDSGRTIRLRVGETVQVVLASPGVQWDLPRAMTSALRRSHASGGYPSALPASATFAAVHSGASAIASVSDAGCLHTRPPCLIPQRLWRVVVIIG